MESPSNQEDSSLTIKQTQVNGNKDDEFLQNYGPSDLRIASEFLATWLPFLSRDLCPSCSLSLSHRIQSLCPSDADENMTTPEKLNGDCVEECNEGDETNSLGSWKDAEEPSTGGGPEPRMSWADMAEDELLVTDEEVVVEDTELERVVDLSVGDVRVSLSGSGSNSGSGSGSSTVGPEKTKLSWEQRERIRFMNVERKKDFICLERVKGRIVNVLEGLELHKGIFSAAEQKRIVECVYDLQEKGMKGELKERTYSAPQKWMRGKGRVTIQFGCCYNYANDKYGNPPGILQHETVDPIPSLFRVIIRRLVRWHVLPPPCVPDSCIVNIYEEGDCIPPHIDNHDFVRPFCTVSFLSECNIVFGTNLKIAGPGEFGGAFTIPLPVGSVLVLNGNSADVAKHCVPSVPTKRISITFRKMDERKHPISFVPEPDLQGILPLPYELDQTKRIRSPKSWDVREKSNAREGRFEARRYQSEPRQGRTGSANKSRVRVNLQS